MDERKIGLGVVALMLLSLVGIVYQGIDKGLGLAMLVIFSVTIAFAMLFFEEWSEEEE